MLQDLLTAGVNEAIRKVDETSSREMEKVTGGMNVPGMFLKTRRVPYLRPALTADGEINERFGVFMSYYAAPLAKLIEQFERLRALGARRRSGLPFIFLICPKSRLNEFARAIIEAKKGMRYCTICQNLTDRDVCTICDSPTRNRSVICVVEDPRDVVAFERTRDF